MTKPKNIASNMLHPVKPGEKHPNLKHQTPNAIPQALYVVSRLHPISELSPKLLKWLDEGHGLVTVTAFKHLGSRV